MLAFEEAIRAKPVESISLEESYVVAVEALEREVNNGGYDQFFTNEHMEAPAIEAALRAIGCPRTADITRDAIAALGLDSLTPDNAAAAVLKQDPAIRDALFECDGRYFDNDEPIADRLFRWIGVNARHIRVGDA